LAYSLDKGCPSPQTRIAQMAALDEDDAAQRRRRKQRHEGEMTMEDGAQHPKNCL
tara:strand:+ start:167 stop:331 length:165 start_codon:yes stop_codon:yes gene_type:complete